MSRAKDQMHKDEITDISEPWQRIIVGLKSQEIREVGSISLQENSCISREVTGTPLLCI